MTQFIANDRIGVRWARRLLMLLLALLTLAIMCAILLPVYRGVSDDSHQRDAAGLPIDRALISKPRR